MSDPALQTKVEPPREARAQVVNVTDPQKLYRVQVRVVGLWDAVPDADLPWAEYLLQGSRGNAGVANPAQVGDWVWVDFPNGDSRYPRITGWCHFAPGSIPNLPHESFAGPDVMQHKRLPTQPVPDPPKYHESEVLTRHGVTIEIEPSGAYRVTQRASGTAIEITKEGHVVIHGENKNYVSSQSDSEVDVGANLIVRVAGDAKVEIGGNASVHTKGFSQHVTDGPALVKSKTRLVLKGPSRTLTL